MTPLSCELRVDSQRPDPVRARRSPFLSTAFSLWVAFGLLAGTAQASDGDEGPAEFPGVLIPARTALIKSRHYEQVAEVPFEVGAQVKAGQLLLRFVDDQERVELERARASLEKARTDYERTRRLHEDQGVSDSLLDEAETDLRLAEADAELAEILLKELSIRAPFDGIVAERHVDPGASVEVGDILLRVTAITPLHVQALLPEAMLPRLAGLKEITVTVGSTDETLRIPYEAGPVVVDPGSGTFLLQLEVDNGDHRLVPGVTCRLTLDH